MQQFIVAAGLAKRPPGGTEQLWPRFSDMTIGTMVAGCTNAVTVRLAQVLVGRVVGTSLNRL